ncbi:cytochrome c [Myxococcus faecalis]|uniref:c-type cytochrome n=1 Tax=Myxococcus faecalis TaxID=3115646 RepID=UPI003CF4A718
MIQTVGMDLPVFHLDFLNNRMLIALIAVLHVVINHGMAVGGIPLVAYLERKAVATGDAAWDALAYRILSCFFIITTTVGALTGVGIWLSASLVNPYAIGSLIRVFFWTWFTEWLVFVTEVILILAYYLTWKKWTGARKQAHVKLGTALSVASWVTMALIVSILGFMMDPGSWRSDRTLFSGMFNPMYLPQLAFRTPLALLMAGGFGLVVLLWATPKASAFRAQAVRVVSAWTLFWTLPCIAGGWWYARVVPSSMRGNLPVALLTQALEGWAQSALWVLGGVSGVIALVMLWGTLRPQGLQRWAYVVPALLSIVLIGTFERVREFVRKPYAIAGYLYSNGLREEDYPLLQRDGLLAHATYTPVRAITSDNELEAGREVFNLACTRCHTVDGVNGIREILDGMYSNRDPSGYAESWDREDIANYIGAMHNVRPFMPPFPGNEREKQALAAWLVSLQTRRDIIEGAQVTGVTAPPRPTRQEGGLLATER